MTRYAVIYEQAGDGSWSVRAADMPVLTVGDTLEEAEQMIGEAIAFHLEEELRAGHEIPLGSHAGTVEVDLTPAR